MTTPKRGKRWTKSARDDFIFETDVAFMVFSVQHSSEYKVIAEAKAVELALKIIKAAPMGPHRFTKEFSVKKNIHANVKNDPDGWTGYITIEENPRARHAMLQERGYTGRDHMRHAGRFFINGVLERERISEY